MKMKYLARNEPLRWSAAFCSIGIIAGLSEGIIQWVRMLLEVPDPMRVEIVWVTPLFYGVLGLFLGLFLGVAYSILIGRLNVPVNIRKWLPLISLGLIIFLSFYNLITLLFKSGMWALALLSLGFATQIVLFLNKRKQGAVRFLAAQFYFWAGLVIVLAVGISAIKWISTRIRLANLPPAPASSPNVILITLDTLRADHLSTYGYNRQTSPNLDQFAAEGVKFDQAYSTAPWTLPSHATIMTGLYTSQTQAEATTGGRLDEKFQTLAEGFSSQGYETSAVIANEFACTEGLGFGQGFDYFNGLFWNIPDSIRMTSFGKALFWKIKLSPVLEPYQLGRKKASDVNAIFLRWLNHRSNRPFFAWLNYFDPHDPYFAPPPFDKLYGSIPASGQAGSFGDIGASDWGGTLSPEETQWQMDHYDAAITYMDAELGKLFAGLRQEGLYDNTIIVITSDHGEAFGEHGLYGHANSLYQEEIKVPLFIRYPKSIPAGEQVKDIVSLRDLAATITDLAGLNLPEPFPGVTLFADNQDMAVAELYQNPYQPSSHPVAHSDLSSITTAQWQAIFMANKTELYASGDTRQQNDLAADQSRSQVLSDLKREMEQILLLSANSKLGDKSSTEYEFTSQK